MSRNHQDENNSKWKSSAGADAEEEVLEFADCSSSARAMTVASVATGFACNNDEDHHHQPNSSVPTMAQVSVVGRRMRDDRKDSIKDKRPSKNTDDGNRQPDINQRHDETLSQTGRSNFRPTLAPVVGRHWGAHAIPAPAARHSCVDMSSSARITQRSTEQQQDAPTAATTQIDNDSDLQQTSTSDVEVGTVVANPVTTDDLANQIRSEIREEMHAEAVAAEEVTKKPFWKRKSFLAIVAGALLLAAVGGIIGGVVSSLGKNSDSSSSAPPTSPTALPTTFPTFDVLTPPSATPTVDPVVVATVALVERNSFDGGLSLKNSSSPQHKALDWLLGNEDLGTFTDARILQRFAMAVFYYGTNGTGWRNSDGSWLGKNHECLWTSDISAEFGTACRNGEHISDFDLGAQNLVGQLPSELALLSASLVTINLMSNSLSGPIPSEYGRLTRLESLAMSYNYLSSSIPTEIGVMTLLDVVWLYENHLDGSIPSEIGQLSKLTWLSLSDNELTSTIPSQLNELTDLLSLDLGSNSISGSIPTEFTLLTNLGVFDLSRNNLYGSIPTEIGRLSVLGRLSLSRNRLVGTIPTEIGTTTIRSLRKLFLSNNALTGAIPSEIGRARSLDALYLDNNKLTGTVPSEINEMKNLSALTLFGNSLTPPFECPNFIYNCYISCDDCCAGFDSDCREL